MGEATTAPEIEGFRWPIAVAHPIAAPPGELWGAISAPGNLEPCHPFCERNPVSAWPGPESRDEVHYLNGRVFERRFRRWIEGVGYDLEIRAGGKDLAFVSWRIGRLDRAGSTLGITVCPQLVQRVPIALRWLPHLAYIRPRLRSYLSAVVRGFDWYLRNGEPVPRNRFGSHPWFSS